MPAGILLAFVMMTAYRIKITFEGQVALVVRDRVIVVASSGGPAAAGEPAPRAADLHPVPEPGCGPVAGGLEPVGAGAGLDRGDLDRGQPGSLVAAGRPGPGPGAPVSDRPPGRVGQGDAPARAGASGERSGQVAASGGVGGPGGAGAGDLAGPVAQVQPGGQRHGELHPGQRARAGAGAGGACGAIAGAGPVAGIGGAACGAVAGAAMA